MSISATRYVILVAAINGLLYHVPLFKFATSTLEPFSVFGFRVLTQLSLIVLTVTAVFLYIVSFLSLKLLRIASACLMLCNSIALYFVSTYGVFLDKSMMGNVINTRTEEAVEYLGVEPLLYFVLLGILPAIILWRLKIQRATRLQSLSQASALLAICLTVIYVNGSIALWFDQYSRRLGGMMLPWSYTINTIRSQSDKLIPDEKIRLLPAPDSISAQKSLVVLIIGETARASNFTAYGYGRNTHPTVSAAGAVFLPDTTACATYTTASIRCMFSHDGSPKGDYEPLPSYLQRHQVEVIWRTNNWGEPKLNLNNYTLASQLRNQCQGDGCNYDEVLLQDLKSELTASERDKILLVLHTKGSHGPAYHKRYPSAFEQYKPSCKSVDLSQCSSASLVNVYDNTIVYTDYFISQTIAAINDLTDRSVALLYISDHGESLGEYGLYLHGTPKLVAPDYQLKVPFAVWMSEEFKGHYGLDELHFNRKKYSHANVYHSVLGALGVRNSVYDERLDIFSPTK